MEAVFSDSVSPAICMNEGCDFTCAIGAKSPISYFAPGSEDIDLK
jgi:hypothetical protein